MTSRLQDWLNGEIVWVSVTKSGGIDITGGCTDDCGDGLKNSEFGT